MSDPVVEAASTPWWTHIVTVATSVGFTAMVAKIFGSRAEVEVAELDAETKRREANVNERETTGEHVLKSWHLLLEQVQAAQAEVKAERAAYAQAKADAHEEREAYRRARDDAAAARRQADLDHELAESAMNQNEACQEALVEIRAENAKTQERLAVVEATHAECPAKIKKLSDDVAYLRYLNDKKSDVPPAP